MVAKVAVFFDIMATSNILLFANNVQNVFALEFRTSLEPWNRPIIP